nr:transcriptional regulator [Gluconobacter cerinus]
MREVIPGSGGQRCGQPGGGRVDSRSVRPGHRRVTLSIGSELSVIGWSARQAARRSGVSKDRILRWQDGQGQPDPHFLKWLSALGFLHRRLSHPLARAVPPPGNRPPLNGYAVTSALITIGWSERVLAERLGEHRTALRRLISSHGHLPVRESRWLEALADGHRDLPRPLSPICLSPDP